MDNAIHPKRKQTNNFEDLIENSPDKIEESLMHLEQTTSRILP